MKKFFFVAFATTTLFITKANAQKEDKNFSFGFGVETGFLIGDKNFKTDFSSEFGLSFRFSAKVGPGYITFTPGGTIVLPKSVNSDAGKVKMGTHIPIKVGYKYIIDKFFVMGEVGYSSYALYLVDENTTSYDNLPKVTGGGFTYAPSVGLNLGVFELALRYQATAAKFSGIKYAPSTVGLRIGFNF
jgi:hypothetical protein